MFSFPAETSVTNKVLSTEHIPLICLNEHESCVPSEERGHFLLKL